MAIDQLVVDLNSLSLEKFKAEVNPEFSHLDEVTKILTEILDLYDSGEFQNINQASNLMQLLGRKAKLNPSIDLKQAAYSILDMDDGDPVPENTAILLGAFIEAN